MNKSEVASIGMALSLLIGVFVVAFVCLLAGRLIRRVRQAGEVGGPPVISKSDMVRTWWVIPADGFGLGLMCLIFMSFGISALVMENAEKKTELTADALVWNVVMFAGFVGMVYAMVSRRVRLVQWLGLRWAWWWHLLWFGPLVVVSMWGVMGILQWSGYIEWIEKLAGTPSMQQAVELMKMSEDVWVVGLMAFSAAVVAPLAEEIIFRGYIYPVAKKWSGRFAAVIFSALWFSACHGNIPLMLPLFLLGIILALAYEKTGSIWAPIGIHFFFNSATVLIQLAIRVGWIADAVKP